MPNVQEEVHLKGKKNAIQTVSSDVWPEKMPLGSYAVDLGIGGGMKKRRANSM